MDSRDKPMADVAVDTLAKKTMAIIDRNKVMGKMIDLKAHSGCPDGAIRLLPFTIV
jgi:hypothetical protein